MFNRTQIHTSQQVSCFYPKFTFEQKAGWLMRMPLSAINKIQNLKLLEADWENWILRWLSFWNNMSEEMQNQSLEWSQHVMKTESEAQWTVQQDRYLQEGVQVLRKSLLLSTDNDKENMEVSQCQLDAYKKGLSIWMLNTALAAARYGQLEGNMPCGPIKRLFKTYRKNPNWYHCEWLCQDCAGHGGCCGWDCGCCERVRTISRRPLHGWGHGHCTNACGCCIHTLGYSEGEMNKQTDIKNFPFDISSYNTQYSRWILWAYIFRVPFLDDTDLIWIMKKEETKHGGQRLFPKKDR